MKKEYKERLEYVDILRGISIILMVIGHIRFGKYFDKYLHTFHMPVWFFISGFFYSNREISFFDLFIKKGKRLLIPYFCMGLLHYPLWILLQKTDEPIFEPLRHLFWENTHKIMPISGAIWFLTCLFWAELLYWFINKMCHSLRDVIIIACILAVAGNYYNRIFESRLPWAMDVSFVAVGLICLGNCARIFENSSIVSFFLHIPLKHNFVIFVLNGISGCLNGYVNMRTGMYGFVPWFWVNALSAIIVYWNFSRYIYEKAMISRRVKEVTNILQRIGRNSIIYLCINQLVILCVQILCKIDVQKAGEFNISSFVIAIIVIPIMYLLDLLISKCKIRFMFGML